jgi:hypothetical protein
MFEYTTSQINKNKSQRIKAVSCQTCIPSHPWTFGKMMRSSRHAININHVDPLSSPRRPHRYDNEANPLFLCLSQLSLQSARNKENKKTAAFFFFLCGTHCRIFKKKERQKTRRKRRHPSCLNSSAVLSAETIPPSIIHSSNCHKFPAVEEENERMAVDTDEGVQTARECHHPHNDIITLVASSRAGGKLKKKLE